ncbi:MAG: nuclear transport factor 2 family protein [Chloroherpetonaceae bacterium]|nr:nuclear transport factor 2 family protein [Chloroherpetonaceae bacterium]MCS7211929.1 nuclear transport factor 2 family protein [Chloroherpetonaceae bacterium]MDW8020355.1 nuclear transport factor 2 family protein [Chloroherpetonaceae bacterium]MDW8466780.1 nuclear transport factor 2 family protein [Chloroherpetonaceae bacterium]
MKQFAILSVFIALYSLAMAQTGDRETGDREAILAVLNAQVADWNRGDIRGFMQGYKRSDSTRFISSKGIEQGYEKILQRYLRAYPDQAAMGSLRFEGLQVKLLSERYAIVNGQFILVRRTVAGEAQTLSGYFTLLFEKTAEGWKIVLDHTS